MRKWKIGTLGMALALSSLACEQSTDHKSEPVEIQVSGALRTIMREGNLAATVSLDTLSQQEHVFGLGAAANLEGELMIWDGAPYRSYMQPDSTMDTDSSWAQQAALLVTTQVQHWAQVSLPDTVTTPKALEGFLGTITTEPLPFLLKGQFTALDWHIIHWPTGDTVHSHAKHQQAGLHGTALKQNWEVLGFYSDRHHGVFTHHSTNLHMHAKAAERPMVAHVDGFTLSPEVTLWIPATH